MLKIENHGHAADMVGEALTESMLADERDDSIFSRIRKGIIGTNVTIRTPYGDKRILYADWCATGRLYRPIERFLTETIGPYAANTHTHSNTTGSAMTKAYKAALQAIKRHVHAGPQDIVLSTGTGMTGAVNKLQRLMELRVPERYRSMLRLPDWERPVIFISHMEHHSNHTSWLETIGDVVIVPPDASGLVSPGNLDLILNAYRHRPYKIGAFTACSNVTGIETPVHQLARVMHMHGGLCFADYSASAPYVDIDMHPADPRARLDAVLFSPHKFLGGPGAGGILVFDSRFIRSRVPDHPGGGTVSWTNPWGGRKYLEDLEEREDGGTPGFMQAIRTSLCIQLKERVGTGRIARRERELLARLWPWLDRHPRIRILEDRHRIRLPIVSFNIAGLHHHLVTRLLNDRFGIQVRGGCSCAGSYSHYLFGIGPKESQQLYEQVAQGNPKNKPGWVRISLHPTMSEEDVDDIGRALGELAVYGDEWAKDYIWDPCSGDFRHAEGEPPSVSEVWKEAAAALFE